MPSNSQAITDLEKSKKVFQDQVKAGASGLTLSNLMDVIDSISVQVGRLETQALNAGYVPQTDDFRKATTKAKAFIAKLNAIKTAFNTIGKVVQAVTEVLPFIV